MLILCHSTATIAPPELQVSLRTGLGITFVLTQAAATRSERYISSLERTDLGVPLEVEFEETPSRSSLGDVIVRSVLTAGTVYNLKIWSINAASFSYDPVAGKTVLFDTGKEQHNLGLNNLAQYVRRSTCNIEDCVLPCTAPSDH